MCKCYLSVTYFQFPFYSAFNTRKTLDLFTSVLFKVRFRWIVVITGRREYTVLHLLVGLEMSHRDDTLH